jgi:hypothetical protein
MFLTGITGSFVGFSRSLLYEYFFKIIQSIRNRIQFAEYCFIYRLKTKPGSVNMNSSKLMYALMS